MLHMLQLSPKHFQGVPRHDKRAMQHERDMDGHPIRAFDPARESLTMSSKLFSMSEESDVHPPPNDDFVDLLRGAQRIADYIGRPYRQTVYLLETQQLPAWKIGQQWHSTKAKLRARLLGEDGGGDSDDR
jgi:hypothetical protein